MFRCFRAIVVICLVGGPSACGRHGEPPDRAVERAIDRGRAEDAWNLAGEAVRADSSSAAAWIGLARAALATLRCTRGVDAASRAVELSGRDPEAYLLRAYLNQRRLRNVAAVADADRARALAPDDVRCVRAAGEMRLGGGMVGSPDYGGAAAAFRAALVLDSTDVRSRFGLGKALVLSGRPGDGLKWLDAVIAERVAWGEAYYLRGLVRMRDRDFEGAIREFETAAQYEPTMSAAAFNRARMLDRLGRPDEASETRARVTAARELAERTKNATLGWHETETPGAGLQLVRALRDGGQWEEALQLAGTLTADFPRLPPAARELAEVALAMENMETARSAAERAVALAPRDPQARRLAARASAAVGDQEAALGHAREAVALSPEDPAAAALLGKLLVQSGDPLGALGPLDEVARRGVRDVRIAACRAEAWIALGRYEEAEGLLGRILAAQVRTEWLELRARAYVALGRWTWASDDLRAAVEREPRRIEAWEALTRLLEDVGERDQARESRRRLAEIREEDRSAREALEAWRNAPYNAPTALEAVERLREVERFVDAGRVTRISGGFGERP